MQIARGLFHLLRQSFAVAAHNRVAARLFRFAAFGRRGNAPRKGPSLIGSPRIDPQRYGAIPVESAVNSGRTRSISSDGRADKASAHPSGAQAAGLARKPQ